MPGYNIFLSAVTAEFGSYRNKLRQDLTGHIDSVMVQEDLIVTGTETLDMLDVHIRKCNLAVHLVGDMLGALAKEPSLEVIRQHYPKMGEKLPQLAPFLKPGAPALSYTQWEAWLALYHDKPLIIAAPKDGAPRDKPYKLIQEERAAQQAHLQRLEKHARYISCHFHNGDRLTVVVQRWIRNEDVGHEKRDKDQLPPRDLPLLCDRDGQEECLEKQVDSYFELCLTRPLLLILPGHKLERHDLYIERVKEWSLKRHPKMAGFNGDPNYIVLKFCKSLCVINDIAGVWRELFKSLPKNIEKRPDKSFVASLTKQGIRALLIDVQLTASECSGKPQGPLQLMVDFLASFPDTDGRIFVGIVMSLIEDRRSGWWKQWRVGDWTHSRIQQLEKQYRDSTKFLVKSLPKLESPRERDVWNWLRHDLVSDSIFYVRDEEVAGIFQGRNSLPMNDLYTKLDNLLLKHWAQQRIHR